MNIPAPLRTWLCYYGLSAPPEVWTRFDLVVFDATYHPDLVRREDGGPLILGYLSVAEVLEEGPLWPRVKGRDILVFKKPQWNSWVLDVRDPGWRDVLLREAVPDILAQGFDGVFLDTLDSALALELWTDGTRFKGTTESMVRFMETLRRTFPDAAVAVNRGLPILPRIAESMDLLVLEGLYSTYEGPEKGYAPVDPDVRGLLFRQIEAGLKDRPELPVLTLDYAPEEGRDLTEEAIAYARRKGFIPYVSTVNLDRVHGHTLIPDGSCPGPLPGSVHSAG